MKLTKKCAICNQLIVKRINCSVKVFSTICFCSRKCEGVYKKGKKKPEIAGNKHYRWNNGQFRRSGYIFLYRPKHPYANCNGYVREHRLAMEEFLGRYLSPEEVVHHINEIKDDNRLENLELFSSNSEHIIYHHKLKK